MKIEKLIIINEFLENKVGHYYEYDKSVREAFTDHNIPIELYARSSVIEDIQREIAAIPYFHYDSLPWYRGLKIIGPILYRFKQWRILEKQISQIIDRYQHENVTYFVPNIFWYNILPYARAFSKSKLPVILLYRISVLEAIDLPRFVKPLIIRLFNKAFVLLSKNDKVRFASDSDVIAQQFEEKYKRKMVVLPVPHLFEIHTPANYKDSAFQFYLPGNARVEKGIENITKALEILQENHLQEIKKIVVVLQFFGDKEKDILNNCRERILKLSCKLIALGKLSSEEYQNYFTTSHVILIPYLNDHGYRARTSGILSEAIGACKPFITTKDSWMDVQAKRYKTGIAVSDYDPNELASAMITLIQNFSYYNQLALKAKEEWLVFHSKVNFYKIVMDLQ